MAQLLAAKVAVEEEEPRIRSIQALPTAVLAANGITERGPVRTQTTLTNFEEYVRIYGGFTANGDLTLAMQGFFQNGGTEAHISRVVHYADITDPLTKTSVAATFTLLTAVGAPSAGTILGTVVGPFDLEPADDLDIAVDGGGPATATFNATAGTRTGQAETYALVDGQTLIVGVDGGSPQTVTFNTAEFVAIGAATALEVAAVINAEMTGVQATAPAGSIILTSDKRGTDSQLDFTGGTALATLFGAGGPFDGTGNVADIDAVTVAEVKSIVEAAVSGLTVNDVGGAVQIVSNTTGPTSSILVEAGSTADDELGFDNATHSGDSGAAANTLKVDGKTDGTYANTIKTIIDPPTSGDSTEFNLLVEDDGLIVETFPNVSMIDTAPNFVETIINNADSGSKLIAVTDLDSTAADPRPAEGTFGPLTGGGDGLAGLDDNDFIGSPAGGIGFHAFDQTQGIRVLISPDRPTAAVANGMITYCDTFRDKECFAIIDPPAGFSTTQIITYVDTTAAILNLSEFGAIYWPQIKILNPSKGVFGDAENLTLPPSGHIAGVYARRDAQTPGGVYIAPANIENGVIRGMVGFENEEVLDEKKRDLLYPKRINPITAINGSPRHIDGSRTLKGNGNFPSIPERRGVIFIEQSLKGGLLFLKHVPNTEDNRAVADRTVTLFLLQQMRNGAFASRNPATAFFVDVSEALNPPSVVNAGQMIIRIGLAMAKPAEFIILRVTADTRALEEEVASA
jgi:hypothetical protein